MDSQNAAGPSELTYFELERERLIEDIAERLGKIIGNVNSLNRKIESTVEVGSQFGGVSRLWEEYGRIMTRGNGEQDITVQQGNVQVGRINSPSDIQQQEQSFGLAPGAGSTSYMPT